MVENNNNNNNSQAAMAPLLFLNLFTSFFSYVDTTLVRYGTHHKSLLLLRYAIVSVFVSALRLLSALLSHEVWSSGEDYFKLVDDKERNSNKNVLLGWRGGDCAVGRALTQVLGIMNEIPANSRKYEVVRALAERLLGENLAEGYEPLRKVNVDVLSAAFSRTLSQLEATVKDMDVEVGGNEVGGIVGGRFRVDRVVRGVLSRFGRKGEGNGDGMRGEKLAAEALWLAQKLVVSGSGEEAVLRWSSASRLASLSCLAQPRLQVALVKVSAFLFSQAKDMGGEECEESKREEQRQAKLKMLLSWLPFLCRASIGTDVPALSFNEKAEIEGILGEMIESLQHEEEREKVLSLWLHHFTHCPSSDWPNLHSYYARWCALARKHLILN